MLLCYALVMRWEMVPGVAEGASPDTPLVVHYGERVQDCSATLAWNRIIGQNLDKKEECFIKQYVIYSYHLS